MVGAIAELQNATALTHAQVAQLLEPKREMLQDMDATQQAYASWESRLVAALARSPGAASMPPVPFLRTGCCSGRSTMWRR